MLDLILPIVILGLLLSVGVGLLVFALVRILLPIEGTLHDRLMTYKVGQAPASLSIAHTVVTFLTRWVRPYSRQVYGKNDKFLKEIRQTLAYAGQPASDDIVWERLSQQLVVGGLMGGLGLLLGAWWANSQGDTGSKVLIDMIGGVALCGLVGMKLPLMKLKRKAKHRQTEIYYALPDVLDLLVICMEAGLAMDAAMQRVAKESDAMSPEMAYELNRLQSEIGAGIPRGAAFNHLADRTSVEELKSLCVMIVQADRMGTSVAQALRVYATDIRTKRRQKAEELAHKAAIKMMFPLVLFIFPALLTVIIGPGLIQIYDTFAKMNH